MEALARIEGYRAERLFLAPNANPTPAALRAGIGALLTSRRYDLVHAHGEIASAICLPALALRPSVATLHGLHVLRRTERFAHTAAVLNLRLVVRSATRTICVAETERTDVVEAIGPRLAAGRVVVIHNGVDLPAPPTLEERTAARAALGLAPDMTAGVFVGSLDDRKDPLVAARAAAAVGRDGFPLVLLFAGDGPLRPELERYADQRPGTVKVLGFQDDVRSLLAGADFFVLPSRREGLPYAVLEAMASGLPVITSDAPGPTEAIGDAGITAPCGDSEGFAAAFRRLLNAEERAALGAAGRERVRRRFSLTRMVRDTHCIYDEVLGVPNQERALGSA